MSDDIFRENINEFDWRDDCIIFNEDYSRAWCIVFDDTSMDDPDPYYPRFYEELTPNVPSYAIADQWIKIFQSPALALILLYGMPEDLASEVAENQLCDMTSDELIDHYYSGWMEYVTADNADDYDATGERYEFNDGSFLVMY